MSNEAAKRKDHEGTSIGEWWFYNRVTVFSGKLAEMTREDAASFITDVCGGKVSNHISSATDFLVVANEKPGKTKLTAAAKHDVTLISEDEFMELTAAKQHE